METPKRLFTVDDLEHMLFPNMRMDKAWTARLDTNVEGLEGVMVLFMPSPRVLVLLAENTDVAVAKQQIVESLDHCFPDASVDFASGVEEFFKFRDDIALGITPE